MTTPRLLDPLSFPLRGSALIEASAGTGKTFTIAALYLRLVLGHGGSAAFPRALVPPQILVVTFTEAATKELRDRIRARLTEAEAYFRDEPVREDELLHALRAGYPPGQWPQCAQALRLAAEWMDEAAVSTIHGWCHRMLREHAFDSGSLFTQTLETDQDELLHEAVRDYWRTFFYPLPPEDVATVADWWPAPAALGQAVRELLKHRGTLGAGEEPAVALAHAREHCARELAELKAPWARWVDELEQHLDAAVAGKRVDGRKLQARYYQPWLRQLRDWAAGAATWPLEPKSTAWTRLTTEGIAEIWKIPPPLQHDALEAMRTLRERLQCLPTAQAGILAHAAHWIADRLALEQERRAEMGFDDLLTRLAAALQGANGPRLAALIREQFPVALIDEFQDTDPLQYRIFDAVYGIARNAQDSAVILIGDPKQAIYAFRGADIHTYLAARRDTEGRHATLGTNFRSTRELVEGVNRFFLRAEERTGGRGAFLFRNGDDNPLPFLPVQAHGRDRQWTVDGQPAPALTCWWRDDGGSYTQAMAASCASEVVRLLQLGQQGRAGFGEAGRPLQALRPGDIAVLVNTGREARAMRAALDERGVRSVYLSDQDSVFASAIAADLQRLLQACAEPDDDRVLRAALATALLGLPWSELDDLNQDDERWEARVLQFRRYREQWRSQGVLPMLRRLLHDFAVPQRLLARRDERTLTDVLHLAELLQEASALLEGEHALVRHLAEQRQDIGLGNESRLVRLESDADLLKVVTVHKSKGLEYPLVFLPFACWVRTVRAEDLPLKWHDDAGDLHLSLRADDEAVERADEERLGEDLRKLYVALTRARYATWVGIAPVKDFERTAVGYLLQGDAPQADFVAAPEPGDALYQPQERQVVLAPERVAPRAARENWWIASYSGLRVGEEIVADSLVESEVAATAAPESAIEATYLESRADTGEDTATAASGGLHDFPRGPSPGSFLHTLLEWAGRQGFAAAAAAPRELAGYVARPGQARGRGPGGRGVRGRVRARAAARRATGASGRSRWRSGCSNGWTRRWTSRPWAASRSAPRNCTCSRWRWSSGSARAMSTPGRWTAWCAGTRWVAPRGRRCCRSS